MVHKIDPKLGSARSTRRQSDDDLMEDAEAVNLAADWADISQGLRKDLGHQLHSQWIKPIQVGGINKESGTLDLFLPYQDDMTVSENWKPLPTTDPAQLSAHLAEFTAREFAHSHAFDLVVLRLGHVVHADNVKGQNYDPMWLDERDAVQAIDLVLQKRSALDRRHHRNYHVLHLQSVSPRARFSSDRICDTLDFKPQYNFEDCL